MPMRKGQIAQRRGKTRKLPGLKVVGGTAAPQTPIKDAESAELFEPPRFLNVHGVQIWQSAVRQLTLIGELSLDHIYGLTELAHMWQRHMKKMESDQDIDWKEHEAFRKLLIEYGLTPAARQHMDKKGLGRVKLKRHTDEPNAEKQRETTEQGGKPANKFASLRQQVAALLPPTDETTEEKTSA